MSNFTPEQALAIETRDVSIALAAGAGCGKTFVLTERFLSHLDRSQLEGLEPAELSQLVAITFTDAAAREMRSRIREKCRERLEKAPSEEKAYWLGLLRAIDSARVSTIHSFCATLLRTHAVALDLDPSFTLLDQGDATVLESDVIDDVLREKLAQHDDVTLDLAAEYSLSRVKQQVVALVDHRHDATFLEWLAKTPADVLAVWRDCRENEAIPAAVGEIGSMRAVGEIIELLSHTSPTKPQFGEARATLLELLPKLQAGEVAESDLATIHELARVKSKAGTFICTVKDWENDKEAYGSYRDACEELRKAIDRNLPPPFDDEVAERAARLGLALLQLTSEVVARYTERKHSLGALDFDDLLAYAHRLLTDPVHREIQHQLSGELRLLLVDEFQDTNQLQVELVKALCGDGFDVGRLFFVGDTKQSIYRFRGAQPEVFIDLRSEVAPAGRLPLSINFRSQPAILSFVNALFCDAFDEYQALRAHRPQITPEPSIEFLWAITPDKNRRAAGMKGAAQEARREEAQRIARRLRALVDGDEKVVVCRKTNQLRRAKLGDIAILFRALSDVQIYEEALRKYGLDYYLVGGQAYYAQQEIHDVLNLLRAVASAADEISLAGVLRSPFFSLDDETLFWLVESGASLNGGLFGAELPAQLSPKEGAKARAAADTIAYLRDHKERLSIAELLVEALNRTAYDAVILGEFLGERKLANLYKLLEQARSADGAGTGELDAFITQLAQFVARQPKEGIAATSPEAADVIRLMTIHQSKGLEFPIVVVPDLDRPEHFRPDAAALDARLGPLVEPADEENRPPSSTGMRLYSNLERIATLEERGRLLYVAVTRGADYLILSSSLEDVSEPKSDWMKFLGERFDLETGSPRVELPGSYELPLIRTTLDAPATNYKPEPNKRGTNLLKLLQEARELGTGLGDGAPPEVAPIPVDQTARAQFSFSRISGRLLRTDRPRKIASAEELNLDDDRPLRPAASTVDPRALGSLVHEVLERIDCGNLKNIRLKSIREWCEDLGAELVLDNAVEAAREAEHMVAQFLASPRAARLARAVAIHREIEFLLAWPPANRRFGEAAQGVGTDSERVAPRRHFRGYIDCLYQDEEDQWHLVDYKTNHITAAGVAREARNYEMQMYVYAMAIEHALGASPKELVLHFLMPSREFTFEWHDEARRRAVEMVDQAVRANLLAHDGSRDSKIGK